jgi:hypothetical protein
MLHVNEIAEGAVVMYLKSDKTFEPAEVKIIHRDDVKPYYTIELNGRELQTERTRLFTIEDINELYHLWEQMEIALERR